MSLRSLQASAFSFALAAALIAHAKGAHAAPGGTRIAVAPIETRGAFTLRLAAELAEMGYVVVPVSTADTADGDALAHTLGRDDAVAALVIEDDGTETLACVVERRDAQRTCRRIAMKNEKVEDAALATRAAELLRALIPLDAPASKSHGKMAAPSTTTTDGAVVETDSREDDSPNAPTDKAYELRIGPGVMLPNGAPGGLSLGLGGDWIATSNFALGLDAMVPLTAGSIDRPQGSATVRATSIATRVDARYATGHWETAAGAGVGLLWLQVNGTATAPYQAIDEGIFDPFAMLHGELAVFVTRTVAVRLDLMGGYTLGHALIRFAGQEVAEAGRPLAMSTLSLALAFQ